MIRNFNSNGTYSIGSSGGINYHRSTQDGHGGRAAEHKEEMRQIAIEVVRELTPQIAAEIYNEAVARIIGAIEYDIETTVSVAFQDVGEIFNSSKYRKIISDRIMHEIKYKLSDLELQI